MLTSVTGNIYIFRLPPNVPPLFKFETFHYLNYNSKYGYSNDLILVSFLHREFVSTTNKFYLSFHSDFSVTTSGYAASWEIVDLSSCLDRRLLVLEPTSLSSLRYPRAYLTGIDCKVTAIAAEPTKRLLITFGDLDLKQQDFLEVKANHV